MEGQVRSEADSGAPAETPRNGVRKRHLALPILAIFVILGIIFGLRWMAYNRTHVSTDDAQIESTLYQISPRISGHIMQVPVTENEHVRAGQLLAQIDPTDYRVAVEQAQAALSQATAAAAAAQGTVNVTQQTGGAGMSQAQSAVQAAQAQQQVATQNAAAAATQVQSARAQQQAAAQGVDVAKRQVTSAQAALRSAQANATEAQRNAERMRTLAAQGAISVQERDAADAAAVTAQSNVESAQAALSAAQSGVAQAQERLREARAGVAQATRAAAAARASVGTARAAVGQAEAAQQASQASPTQVRVTRSQAKSAEANVAAAKAKLDQAELDLSYTRVVSPIDGVVAQKNVREGLFVQPGTPLFAVVPVNATYLDANYKETQLEHIKVGDPASFTVDAYPGLTFYGTVDSISPGTGSVYALLPPENATGNFTKVVQRVPVRVRVDWQRSPNRVLREGMSVVVTVDTGK